jgi:hypothetical protein
MMEITFSDEVGVIFEKIIGNCGCTNNKALVKNGTLYLN